MTERLDPYELIADDDVELVGGPTGVLPREARSTPDAASRDRDQRPGPADGDAPSEGSEAA